MEQCISYLNAKGIEYYDWNVSSGDAASSVVSKEDIVKHFKYETLSEALENANENEDTDH